MKTYKTPWTPERIQELRKTYLLTQQNLGSLLMAPQQRISEWELGRHSMKRPYSTLFTNLETRLTILMREANLSHKKYARLVEREYGITINLEKICDK